MSTPRRSLSLGSLRGLGLLGKLLLGLLGHGLGLRTLLGSLHERCDGIGELGALALPVVDLLDIKADRLGRGQRIVAAHLLDEAAITRGTGIGHDDAIVRTLLRAVTSKANLDCQ